MAMLHCFGLHMAMLHCFGLLISYQLKYYVQSLSSNMLNHLSKQNLGFIIFQSSISIQKGIIIDPESLIALTVRNIIFLA